MVAAATEEAIEKQKPARRPLPEHRRAKRCVTRPPAPARTAAAPCGGSAKRGDRDPRLCTGPLQGHPARAREIVLPDLRLVIWRRRRITRLRAAAPGRGCWRTSSCRSSTITCPCIVRPRSSPAGASAWKLRPVGLGRGDGGGAEAAGQRAGRRCDGIGHTARRRHAGAGAGAGHRQDHPARQIADLLPWHWKPAEPDRAAA